MSNILPLRPVAEPLVVDAKQLAVMLNCGVRTVRTWDTMGKLPTPIRMGGKVVWRVDEIHAWLDAGAPCRKDWDARRRAPVIDLNKSGP